jgi:transposase-like protein/IS1 family transposase
MLPASCGRGGMADTSVSKTDASRHVGSTPTVRTPILTRNRPKSKAPIVNNCVDNNERLLYSLTMMSETQTANMACEGCKVDCQKLGKHRNGLRRFRCPQCRKTYTESHERTLGTMYIAQDRAVLALQLLLEGNSIRSTERITGMDRNTIMSLLVKAGERCQSILDEKIKNIDCFDVEVDEIWGFVFKKESHKLNHEKQVEVIGDAYCFIGMERNCKLVLCHHLGKRDQLSTDFFIRKLAHATSNHRYQLSTDGFKPYVKSVTTRLRGRVDFAQIVKVYGVSREGEARYSPPEVLHSISTKIMGNPDKRRICTSHIERRNLSIRMGMRRMTRLTSGFSKKWGNLEAAYSLWFAYYNFCRVHRTLRVTPAMECGITDHVWTIAELIA